MAHRSPLRRALLVWGGWEGHQPRRCVELFVPFLRDEGFETVVADTLDAYTDAALMGSVDLVVQCWSMGRVGDEQVKGLLGAIAGGAGFAGWHGGVSDAFRDSIDYQFMVGGQFVAHPGGFVDYEVEVVPARAEHPIVAGIGRFAVHTEQYYMHVDPSNDVLATTTFTGEHGVAWIADTVMPVVWTRPYGTGRVFHSTVGHFPEDLRVPEVRAITERGLIWASRAP